MKSKKAILSDSLIPLYKNIMNYYLLANKISQNILSSHRDYSSTFLSYLSKSFKHANKFYGCKGTTFFRMLQYLKMGVSLKYLIMRIDFCMYQGSYAKESSAPSELLARH